MGNGASVNAVSAPSRANIYSPLDDDLRLLEKKAQQHYYQTHLEEFREEVRDAIKNDDITRLEILIKSSNIANLLPLHLAVKYSSLESLELLLSAGLSPLAIDKNGATPLHRAVGLTSENSLLCIYSLLLHSPNCVNLRDLKGNTPLHLAITTHNLAAVEILLSHGASFSLTNAAGHSPRYLAKSMKYLDIVEMIDCKKAGKPLPNRQPPAAPPSPAEMERIMKVWERFFENALSGINFDDADGGFGDEEDQQDEEQQQREEEEEDSDWAGRKTASCVEKGSWSNQDHAPSSSSEVYLAACWWFGYVLCYDASRILFEDETEIEAEAEDQAASVCYLPGSVDGYYVSSCLDLSEEQADLDDHLYRQEAYQVWGGYAVAQQAEEEKTSLGDTFSWPTSIAETIRHGWINCYLSDSNECVWLHLLSYQIQRALPLGGDALSGDCGCEWTEEAEEGAGYWLRPPQVAARAWIVVRCCMSEAKGMGEPNSERKEEMCEEQEQERRGSKGGGWSVSPLEKGHSDKEIGQSKRSGERLGAEEKLLFLSPRNSTERDGRGDMGDGCKGEAKGEWRGEEKGQKGTKNEKEERESPREQERGQDERAVWYYYNRVSGQSSWEEPAGWREVVSLAGGWILCAEEETLQLEGAQEEGEMYWWNECTGDVLWYGEDYHDQQTQQE
jgi:hypothetical protein